MFNVKSEGQNREGVTPNEFIVLVHIEEESFLVTQVKVVFETIVESWLTIGALSGSKWLKIV